jgi:hypothetical protein
MAEVSMVRVQVGENGKDSRLVTANVRGKLALHTSLMGAGMTITHIRTGFAVFKRIPNMDAPIILSRLEKLDWEFDSPGSVPEGTKAVCQQIKQEYGL